MIWSAVLAVVVSYLIGSINFAVIFTKAFKKGDIRDYGSGNAGTTNVMRVGGPLPGILTFICDAFKGFASCMIGKLVFEYISQNHTGWWAYPLAGAYICAVACMVGHIFPVFFGFRGGKGVATSVGIFAVCAPVAIIIGLITFAALTLISKYVSVGSLVATVVVIALSIFFARNDPAFVTATVSCVIMATLIYYKHLSNIKRLLNGTENKIKSRR